MTAQNSKQLKTTLKRRQSLAPPLATTDLLKDMYRRMLHIRKLCGHECSCSGLLEPKINSEGVTVGVAVELQAKDTLCAELTHLLQCAASTTGTEFRSVMTSLTRNRGQLPLRLWRGGPGIVPPDSSGRAQIALGVGVAHAFRALEQPAVCVVLAGAWSSSLISAFESLELAALQKLPVIFLIENTFNGEADQHHTFRVFLDQVGFPSIPVDGNDSIAVHRVATEAVQRARMGGGPTLIECQIASAADALRLGLAADPLVHMQEYLRKHGLWSDAWNQELQLELNSLRNQVATDSQ